MAYQTVVQKARFNHTGFDVEHMQRIAENVRTSIHKRITSGTNVYDLPAKPLMRHPPVKEGKRERGYGVHKQQKMGKAIRDWVYSGHTMRMLKVLSVSVNKAVIGFLNEIRPGRSISASQIAWLNNRRDRQWGISPQDRNVIRASFEWAIRQQQFTRRQAGSIGGEFL